MSFEKKDFTKRDVIELIAERRLDMSDLSARRLSSTQVVIETQNKSGVDVLSAPSKYKDSKLIDLLLHSFTLPDYALKCAISEKGRRNISVISYFRFLETQLDSTKKSNQNAIAYAEVTSDSIYAWRQHLMEANSADYTWRNLNSIQKILSRTLATLYGKTLNWPKQIRAIWFALKANTPAKPAHQKTPPLGIYLGISSDLFSEEELYMGFRYGVIWLLQKLGTHRNTIVEHPVVSEILHRHKGKTTKEFDQHFAWSPKHNNVESLRDREALLTAVLRCIQDDELITEWQCYSFTKLHHLLNLDRQLLQARDQEKLLSRYVSDGKFRMTPKGYGQNDAEWKPFKKLLGAARDGNRMPRFRYWGSDLISHSALERLLMVWLLASERAQRAGIEKLTLKAVHFSGDRPKSMQISTLKLRRAVDPSSRRHPIDISTQIYKKNDPPFQVYMTWHQIETRALGYFKNHNPQNKFIYPLSHQITGTIYTGSQKHITDAYKPLKLLATPGTIWSTTFLKESGNSREAQAFIAILANRINKKKTNTKSAVCIPPSFVGQSLVMKKELANNFDNSLIEIESEAMGHSTVTGRNVYKDGFSSLAIQEIIEPIRVFARRVGDEKISLAEKIANEMKDRTRKIDFVDLEKLCGVESSTRQQKELLALLDEQDKVNISGELIINGELLIVESDFTAALMYGYIRHLESFISEITLTSRDETALRHLSKYLYLHQIFNSFSPHIQESAKLLAKQTNFPFPPLS